MSPRLNTCRHRPAVLTLAAGCLSHIIHKPLVLWMWKYENGTNWENLGKDDFLNSLNIYKKEMYITHTQATCVMDVEIWE